MDDDHAFDRLLRRLRKARDLTQEALAQQGCCALDTIKKLEAGRRRPSRHLAVQLADVFGLEGGERVDFITAARAGPDPPALTATPDPPQQIPACTNLPDDPLPFIGRSVELALLDRLLADPSTRVLTIVGPGGMGKTRLAIEAARRHLATAHVPDGAVFVSLAALDDPCLITGPLADALGFSLYLRDQREHWTRDKQADQLIAYLRDKRLLLVLDNLEHLVGELSLLSSILAAAPGVKLLATSRERLDLRCETVLPLQGMAVVSEERHAAYGDAVELFVSTAQRAHPGLELSPAELDAVVTICRCVDGMPLGVELAAAWAGILSPAEIAAEIQGNLDTLSSSMRELPERQRSVRAVFDYAWANLSEAERNGVQQLVVFQSDFTREAAQQVAGMSLVTLRSLVQKALVRADAAGRYHVHELLRQFVAERSAGLPEELGSIQERHSAYYVALLAQLEPALCGPGQSEALAAIEHERYNVAAAWKWAAAQGRADLLEQAMESLCEFHRIRGNQEEGSVLFHIAVSALGYDEPNEASDTLGFEETLDLLERPSSGVASNDRHRVLLGRILARWGRFHCESPHADAYTRHNRDAALRYLSGSGVNLDVAYLVRYVGHLGFRPWESRELYWRALHTFEEHGDAQGVAEVRYRLGKLSMQMGEYQDAEQMFRDCLPTLAASGRRTMHANCLLELSYVLWAIGEYGRAERCHAEGYAIAVAIGYRSTIASAKQYAARLALVRRDYYNARQLLRESLTIHEEIGLLGMKAEALAENSQVQVLDGKLTEAAQRAQESLDLCAARVYRAGRAAPLIVLGEVATAQGNWPAAASALREALEVAQEVYLVPYALHALAAVARLFAAAGSAQRAHELAAFIRGHPATWQWTREQLATVRSEADTDLPGSQAGGVESEQRGAHTELWRVLAAAVGELREEHALQG